VDGRDRLGDVAQIGRCAVHLPNASSIS
jgi:hypothetical protein